MGCRVASMSMGLPEKRKSSNAGDKQPNVSVCFSIREPSKKCRWEQVRGADREAKLVMKLK